MLGEDFAVWAEETLLPEFVEHYADSGVQCPWCLWLPGREYDPVHSSPDMACTLEEAKAWLRKQGAVPAQEDVRDE